VVGICSGIVIFSFFYDVIGFQQQRCPLLMIFAFMEVWFLLLVPKFRARSALFSVTAA